MSPVDRLNGIMARLRDPVSGCPWDVEQTFQTIAPYTLEEAYEVADAIERQAWGELKGELGDLLFQAVYHAQMASEAGHFGFGDVVTAISDKMVARHPHVFGEDSRDKSADEQTRDWEKIKAKERGRQGVLDGVALGLPALTRAIKLQNRAARVGFDWPSTAEVIDKIVEEFGGEWRFAGCSMCLGMNPDQLAPGERCASTSNRNFEGRQGYMGRTHLVSPAMAAAAAIAGHFVEIRAFK